MAGRDRAGRPSVRCGAREAHLPPGAPLLPNEAGAEEGGRRPKKKTAKKLLFINRGQKALAHPSLLPLSSGPRGGYAMRVCAPRGYDVCARRRRRARASLYHSTLSLSDNRDRRCAHTHQSVQALTVWRGVSQSLCARGTVGASRYRYGGGPLRTGGKRRTTLLLPISSPVIVLMPVYSARTWRVLS